MVFNECAFQHIIEIEYLCVFCSCFLPKGLKKPLGAKLPELLYPVSPVLRGLIQLLCLLKKLDSFMLKKLVDSPWKGRESGFNLVFLPLEGNRCLSELRMPPIITS